MSRIYDINAELFKHSGCRYKTTIGAEQCSHLLDKVSILSNFASAVSDMQNTLKDSFIPAMYNTDARVIQAPGPLFDIVFQ